MILKRRNFSLISRGLRFFKELKKVEKLPISFEKFLDLMILDILKKRDSSEYKEICDIISLYYNSSNSPRSLIKIGQGLFGSWCLEKKLNPFSLYPSKDNKTFKEGMEFSYTSLQKLPLRYICDSLGAGGFGVVFEYPFNRIEKISYRGFVKEELDFYKYLLKNPLPIFPKIYTLEKDQVIMEKLDVNSSPRLDKYKELIDKYMIRRIGNSMPFREVNWELINKELGKSHEFYKFIENIESGLEKIYGFKTVGDLSRNNIGIRPKTGEVVFFDPVGGEIIMK